MAQETIRKGSLGPPGELPPVQGSKEGIHLNGTTPILLYFQMETPMNTKELNTFLHEYGLVRGKWIISTPYGDPKTYLDEIRREVPKRFSSVEFSLEAYRLNLGQHV